MPNDSETKYSAKSGEAKAAAHTPDGTFSFANLQPSALCISGLVTIHMDGRLEFAPGVTLDEAAESFWKRIAEAFPGLFLPRDALHSAAPDLLEALKAMLARYASLAGSGDCGFWDLETENEVIAARSAIQRAEGQGT